MRKDKLNLDLRKGEIVADVDPKRHGPPFVVQTPHGRVRVTGTVFSVDVDADHTVVRVLRGRVEATDASGQVRTLKLGQSLAIGQGAVAQISQEEIALADERLQLLDLVIAPDAAELDVTSLPHGAVLTVDGIELGTTPIAAMVRPGARNRALNMDGHESVKELLHVSPGSKVTRVFELKELDLDESEAIARKPRSVRRATRPSDQADTPEALLKLAQSHLKAGRWSKAIQTYEVLAEQYPNSALGRTALVSMGMTQLERVGRYRDALRSFNRYLKTTRRGTNALEASWGRARALRALGNREAERKALREFLRDFPEAIQAPSAQERLDQLQ